MSTIGSIALKDIFISSQKWLLAYHNTSRCQWLTPVILATGEVELGGSQYKANPGKMKARSCLKNTQHKKGMVEWLKR
jgi:hypothetical protein